ncbi:MAG: hypothetical protein LBV00_06060, partial [Propionibacteriaceae bacterium]|jgi:hypothetical protein|nr:hypothetical protein [Propionibacteriaceae bacterium]
MSTAEVLAQARVVAGNRLVGAAEPVATSVMADVIHMTRSSHVDRWPGRLTGCTVTTQAEMRAALVAGCSYVVVDWRQSDLIGQVAMMAAEYGDVIWFASGCRSLADARHAVMRGARRIWLDAADFDLVARLADRLRRAWSADPVTSVVSLADRPSRKGPLT